MATSSYGRAQASRDLSAHKPARVALALYAARYAKSGLGAMGFWDSLTRVERATCRELYLRIVCARDERADEHPDEPRWSPTQESPTDAE